MIKYNEEIFTYAEVSEMIHNANYDYLLEGFTYPAASELMFEAKNSN